MMYLLYSCLLLGVSYTTIQCKKNIDCHEDIQVIDELDDQIKPVFSMDDEDIQVIDALDDQVKTVVSMETELSLKKLAMIYKKLLHDQEAIINEHFEDKNLATEVAKIIDERVITVREILTREAPDLAKEVEESYARPKRMMIIYTSVAVVALGASIFALFSYDPITKTWGSPKLLNAKNSLERFGKNAASVFTSEDEPTAAE